MRVEGEKTVREEEEQEQEKEQEQEQEQEEEEERIRQDSLNWRVDTITQVKLQHIEKARQLC